MNQDQRLEVIKNLSGTKTAFAIGQMLGLSASGVKNIASKHGISLRRHNTTFFGAVCEKCGHNERYIKAGSCVNCKKEKNKKRYESYYDNANVWLKRRWI